MEDIKDFCLSCGAEHESELWGAACLCGNANVVHQHPCTGCGRIIGQITDDDYCGPEKLYCPDCMDAARTKTPNVKLTGAAQPHRGASKIAKRTGLSDGLCNGGNNGFANT